MYKGTKLKVKFKSVRKLGKIIEINEKKNKIKQYIHFALNRCPISINLYYIYIKVKQNKKI